MYAAIGGLAANAFARVYPWRYYLLGAFLLLEVFLQVCRWRIYIKMGEPGWVGLIPIWRIFILLFRAWHDWAPVYFFIPVLVGGSCFLFDHIVPVIIGSMLWGIAVEVYIVGLIKLAKGTGHSAWFGLGLFFMPLIFYPRLAFTN